MVKVCHLTSVHKRYDTRIFQKMCRSLASNGYDVTLLVMDDLPDEVKDGVKIISVPFKPKNRIDRIMNSGRQLYKKALELDCDLYHFHDPELLPVGLKLKRRGKKVIYDSHENYPEQIMGKNWIPGVFRKLISLLFKWHETRICRQLDAVVFPCTVNGKNIFEERAAKTAIIGNVPILRQAVPGIEDVSKKSGQICLVGGLTECRGVTSLVKALEFCDAELVMAGPIEENYLHFLRSLPGWAKVDYRGRVSFEEAQKIISSSRIGTSILRNVLQYGNIDIFATKIYEYMNGGIPVVMNNARYNKVQNDRLHFGVCVDPDSPQEIAEAINYLFSHPEEAKEMGRNGRKAVEEEFNWNVEFKKLLDLYNSILQCGKDSM